MSINHIINEITNKLITLTFSDGTKFIDVISSPIVNNQQISFVLFINKNQYNEALLLQKKATIILQQEIPNIKKVNIVVSNKDNSYYKNQNNNIPKEKIKISGVRHIIPIISGKGGVGKSTISSALAQELKDQGFRVGLLDADFYGPSIPIMFGISQNIQLIQNKIVPINKNGIDVLSLSLLVNNDSPLAWRGAMTSKALHQLLMAQWNNIDYLILDMPPGTGDIHITLTTNYEIFGVIAVTTPQLVSTSEVRKSLILYRKLEINILGIVENMSYLTNSDNNTIFPFGKSGAQSIAREFQIPLLTQIPLNSEISAKCDQGQPINHIINIDWLKYIL
ncbi:cobQ/CobB/MinD/ParA nucleotide binding domain protein [Orientia chuto str. Dubai]|uniref:Iron-sulfur cluster carrier protein n=1 Tax=Orientia chuto str. Dubai TaxID=1359168 RepID=A0A0F3MKT4_9RICK|nr:Mrp/NBP35 family ATP-binding protein [Candidatus Orientia mediorientalis]KJV56360.1 cobQ/CobB/MinD/ParA nucleotide binding domain protein [Orientia chuto str. Dubai]